MHRYKKKTSWKIICGWKKKLKSGTITKSICANFSHYVTFKMKISAPDQQASEQKNRKKNVDFGNVQAHVFNKNFVTLFKARCAAAMPNTMIIQITFHLSLFFPSPVFFLVNTCAAIVLGCLPARAQPRTCGPDYIQIHKNNRFNTLPAHSWPSRSKNLRMKKCKKLTNKMCLIKKNDKVGIVKKIINIYILCKFIKKLKQAGCDSVCCLLNKSLI